MKTLRILFGFILMAAVVGCSSDDSVRYEYNKNNLTGTYSLKYYESMEKRTVVVDGFDVKTTISKKGDTFDGALYSFSSNDIVTTSGAYRIVETKTQAGQTQESNYIINLDGLEFNYTVQESMKKLTIDGISYDVENFNETGFRLKRKSERVDGETTIEFEEELRFEK